MLVIHVVPQLPPAICGVGDYATVVGGRMQELDARVKCKYLTCGLQSGHETTDGHLDNRGKGQTSPVGDWRAFWTALEKLTGSGTAIDLAIVVHYSGYGYAFNGAPAWLARALVQRPSWFRHGRVITFFHELYATGWPWQRAFWYSRRQIGVAKQIARSSNSLMTNRQASAQWLEKATARSTGSVAHLPVFSNVGEPAISIPWDQRAKRIVLFGNERFKTPFLAGAGAAQTVELCRRLKISRIVDIGKHSDCDSHRFRDADICVEHTGFLPGHEVGDIIANARAALIDYFPNYYGKSGVLAAMAAFGTPAIVFRDCGESDGLRLGEELITLKTLINEQSEEIQNKLRRMSKLIRQWYEPHSIANHARQLMAQCWPEPLKHFRTS